MPHPDLTSTLSSQGLTVSLGILLTFTSIAQSHLTQLKKQNKGKVQESLSQLRELDRHFLQYFMFKYMYV